MSVLSALKAGFFSSARARLETALLAGRPHRGMGSRKRLRMSITGSSSIHNERDVFQRISFFQRRARNSR